MQGPSQLSSILVAVGRVLGQCPGHRRIEAGREQAVVRAHRRRGRSHMLHQNGHGGLATEGHASGERLKEDDGQ